MADLTLNPAQHDAVIHSGGPLLVVAGAGSGKTRVLTHRIAHLITDEGVSPFAILAITFTNKAADEMKTRVAELVGTVAGRMWVSTFHSACVRMLRRDGHHVGYASTFSIYDQADAVRLTGYVLRDQGVDTKRFPARSIHAQISTAKNELVDPATYRERVTSILERRIADVYEEYQRRLVRAGAMDFDDLLTVTVDLFRNHPDVLEHYQQRFEHVLVDEYQDTNPAQNEIVLRLGEVHRNVCVVGDADQCLPPGTLISTERGPTPVEQLAVGDVVFGTGGGHALVPAAVAHVHRSTYHGPLYEVSTGEAVVRGTPHHLVPATLGLDPGGGWST